MPFPHPPCDVVVVVQDVEQAARQVHAHQHRQHRAVRYASRRPVAATPVRHHHRQEPHQPLSARPRTPPPHRLWRHVRGRRLQRQLHGLRLLLHLQVRSVRRSGKQIVLAISASFQEHVDKALAHHGVDLAERHDVGVHETLHVPVLLDLGRRPVHQQHRDVLALREQRGGTLSIISWKASPMVLERGTKGMRTRRMLSMIVSSGS